IHRAMQEGMSIEQIHELSHIDPWFLAKLKNIVDVEKRIQKVCHSREDCHSERSEESPCFSRDPSATPQDDYHLNQFVNNLESKNSNKIEIIKEAKLLGFSDLQIAKLTNVTEKEVRKFRTKHGILPITKQIDTLAAEFPAKTNYLYNTYNACENDVQPGTKRSVMVLGSGSYRIGSSVEFDWCCVNTVQALRRLGFSTIMVNCNPETVSTDFDECDRLYFEEITLERVLDIYEREQPMGIILAVGGQTANNLAIKLAENGVNILGTQASSIDQAEDRHKFSKLLDDLKISQPQWRELKTIKEALEFADKVGYPVLVRPSYVLSGAAMATAMNDEQLTKFLEKAADVSPEHPVVISKFILDAKEIELDGVAKQGNLAAYVISEHVENAGVHSGDATMVVPPQRTYLETIRQVKKIASRVAQALQINGPFNIQFLAKDNDVSVIECNLRSSRSFPFVSKVCGTNLIDIAAKVMLDWPIPEITLKPFNMEYVGVKAPQFSFTRLKGADPTLSVEMASTGEVGCIGEDFEEAFLKAMLSVGFKLPIKSVLISAGPTKSKAKFLPAARMLNENKITIYATEGTAKFLNENGIATQTVNWPLEETNDSADKLIMDGKVDLVINIPKNFQAQELTNGYRIRRAAADFGVPLITNLQLAKRFVQSIAKKDIEELLCKPWSEYTF
ncbi:carbamoyl-phosphate synthase large subunit, partial [Patescibacteria group bacterium]|nr:carbamoyl-phosphate synthase large subunit [Patescibacteria group bacterium]